ncbi:MAG: tetratricopeptide repeat protein [Kiritimatiellae bacterium]|nr:tetratricopeptide repeat protein [Kiritimatiellia bacterium]
MKYLTLLLSVLLSVSSGFSEETVALAPLLVEAEQSLSEGKWLAAAKAYDEAAKKETGKGRWIALVRGAFARFRLGETKCALETANFVIREARGTVHDSAVGEAFFLKQQILFREKAKPSVRSSLLKTAVARLGWTTEVFRLYETEANLLLREGNADAAWRLYSEERMKPSEAGRNIYGVLRALYSRDRPVTADSVISPLKKLHEIGSPYLDTLLALARKRMGETEKKALLRKVAEWEREAGRKARATALYHECADDGGKRTAGNPESRVSAKSPNGKGAAEKKLWSRANSLIQARKYGEARKCLKGVSSTENKARRDSSLLLIGDCYRKEGRPNDALTVWKSLKGITESVSVLYEADLRAGDLLMTDLYDFDSARKSFAEAKSRAVQSKVLPTDPADEGVALCDALAGRYTEAIGYFQSRRDAAEKRLTADLLKWEALLEVCTNLAVRSHDRVSWERDSAVSELMFAAGRFKAAETAAVNCLAARQAPEDVCARLTMQQARCLAKMGSFEKALSLYGTFLKRYRTSSCAPDALLRAGVLCVGAMGLPDRGCVYFKAVEDGWRLTAQAEQALFYRLTVNLWTGNLKAASELREVFMKRYPRSNHLGIVRDEYGSLLTKKYRKSRKERK